MNLVPLILVQRCIMTIQLYNFLSGNQIDKNIQISNGPVFEWLGLWLKPDHLKTRPFEIRTSNVSRFRMVGFQILTVVLYFAFFRIRRWTFASSRLSQRTTSSKCRRSMKISKNFEPNFPAYRYPPKIWTILTAMLTLR